jgi:DeoR family transcriptional regulator, fructose operon transcriptional repressor
MDREKYILDQLDEKGSVRVSDLSAQLQLSEVTIRSDIRSLERKGLLKRVHGGAVKITEQLPLFIAPGNVLKKVEEKKRIAAKAYEYIDNGDMIVLDDSSVSYYLAEEIRKGEKKNLIVITNSLAAAVVLSSREDITLAMVGGQIGGNLPSAMGQVTVDTISNYKANKAFISAHGVNFDVGITSIGTPQMHVKQAILDSADKIYLMIDSSKFSGGYLMVVCPLERLERIITDKGISEADLEAAERKQIKMDIV